jgi:hypothetical protein
VTAELSIRFTQQGGYVFEAVGIRNVEIADRIALAGRILSLYEERRWRKEWLLVDAVYVAASGTIIVSEDSASEIRLNVTGSVPLGALPLADPKLGLSISSSSGKIAHVIAQNDLRPLYSCLKVHDPMFGSASLVPVRGMEKQAVERLTRLDIRELLES